MCDLRFTIYPSPAVALAKAGPCPQCSPVVKSFHAPFRLFTLAVFAAATVPRLMHRGMFVDGVTYASIARTLAEGRGRFWAPFYTSTIYPQFHEHLPLGFWLQSLWFRVLGDHLFV